MCLLFEEKEIQKHLRKEKSKWSKGGLSAERGRELKRIMDMILNPNFSRQKFIEVLNGAELPKEKRKECLNAYDLRHPT